MVKYNHATKKSTDVFAGAVLILGRYAVNFGFPRPLFTLYS